MKRIPSGVIDQLVYFVAVDSADFTTRETGLATFTVYRSRNGAAAAVMTTPTVAEVDATNMPGLYTLLLDEDMTIDAGNESEQMVYHITHAGMAPVTIEVEVYRSVIDTLSGKTRRGTAQAGAATTITLDTGASAVDDFYNGALIVILEGTGDSVSVTERTRRITDYVGSTRVATVDEAWAVNPDATSVFLLIGTV